MNEKRTIGVTCLLCLVTALLGTLGVATDPEASVMPRISRVVEVAESKPASDIDQERQMVHVFVKQHPTVDIIHIKEDLVESIVYRYCVLESEVVHESGRRERLPVILRVGSLQQGVLVNRTPEASLVDTDRVNLRPTNTIPYVSLEKCDP